MIKSVKKVFDILKLLKTHSTLGLTEISKELGIPKTTVFNILCSLEEMAIVQRNSENKYFLGIECFQLGNSVASHWVLREEAEPFMRKLWEKTRETINLTVLDNDELLYINSIESPQRLHFQSLIGIRAPLHCTGVGKAILAFLPESKIDEIIKIKGLKKFTSNTITDPKKLKEELKLIRRRGYAVDNMEIEEGVRCVAAPIKNHNGVVFASISVSGPQQRILDEEIPGLAEVVKATANDISKSLKNKILSRSKFVS